MSHLTRTRKILSSVEVLSPRARLARLVLSAALCGTMAATTAAGQSTPPAPAPDLKTHIANLSSLDFPTRTNAARMIRRAPAAEAAPALAQAAAKHADEFVRYRALIVLSSFNDRGTAALVRGLLTDRNDRVREVAYKWLEANPDPGLTPTLLASLQTEQAEFVRPALVGALAALGDNPQVQRALLAEVPRGLDFFRSAVIDALGRHRAEYAVDAIAAVAPLEGPLQDDAILALGRIGGPRAAAALAKIANPRADLVLTVRGAQCLLGDRCDAAIKQLVGSAAAPGAATTVVRAAVAALAAIAATRNDAATAALVGLADRGVAVRDQVMLGFATVAVRNPDHLIGWMDMAPGPVRTAATQLLKEGFEDQEDDFGEEQFFAAARAAYWKAGEGTSGRALAAALIQALDF
jgi:HEAT repeat protein